MTTHPKREYTQQDILGMANALRGIQGRASYVNRKLDEASDMLESLASQLAAQKREGEQESRTYTPEEVAAIFRRTYGCDMPELKIKPDQDREVSP